MWRDVETHLTSCTRERSIPRARQLYERNRNVTNNRFRKVVSSWTRARVRWRCQHFTTGVERPNCGALRDDVIVDPRFRHLESYTSQKWGQSMRIENSACLNSIQKKSARLLLVFDSSPPPTHTRSLTRRKTHASSGSPRAPNVPRAPRAPCCVVVRGARPRLPSRSLARRRSVSL